MSCYSLLRSYVFGSPENFIKIIYSKKNLIQQNFVLNPHKIIKMKLNKLQFSIIKNFTFRDLSLHFSIKVIQDFYFAYKF